MKNLVLFFMILISATSLGIQKNDVNGKESIVTNCSLNEGKGIKSSCDPSVIFGVLNNRVLDLGNVKLEQLMGKFLREKAITIANRAKVSPNVFKFDHLISLHKATNSMGKVCGESIALYKYEGSDTNYDKYIDLVKNLRALTKDLNDPSGIKLFTEVNPRGYGEMSTDNAPVAANIDYSIFRNWAIKKINIPATEREFNEPNNILIAVIDTGVSEKAFSNIEQRSMLESDDPSGSADIPISRDRAEIAQTTWDHIRVDSTDTVTINVDTELLKESEEQRKSDRKLAETTAKKARSAVLGHGTGIVSIITFPNNGELVAKYGSKWKDTSITKGIKVISIQSCSERGRCSDLDVTRGICYAASRHAKVINVSISGPYDSKLLDGAIEDAVKAGSFVVVAGGNQPPPADAKTITPTFPNTFARSFDEGAISVGATDNYGLYTVYSPGSPSYSNVEIVAPGRFVRTFSTNGKPYLSAGTSFAAAYVSGAAALILATRDKNVSPADLERILRQSSNKKLCHLQVTHGACISDRSEPVGLLDVKKALETP